MAKIKYDVKPGQVVPSPDGKTGNFFPALFLFMMAWALLGHILEGNVKVESVSRPLTTIQTQQTKGN